MIRELNWKALPEALKFAALDTAQVEEDEKIMGMFKEFEHAVTYSRHMRQTHGRRVEIVGRDGLEYGEF